MSASAAPAPPPAARRGAAIWIFAVLCLLIGAGIGYGVADHVLEHRRMAADGVAAEGRMTGGYRQVTSGRSRTTRYYPTFTFWTADRHLIVATATDEVERSDIQANRTMPIRYDPQDPNKIRLASAVEGGLGVLPWIGGILALFMGFIGIMLMLPPRRPKV